MVATIAGELEGIASIVVTAAGASPDVAVKIKEGIDGLNKAAIALAGADAGAQGAVLMQRVATDANALLALLPPPQAARWSCDDLVEESLELAIGQCDTI